MSAAGRKPFTGFSGGDAVQLGVSAVSDKPAADPLPPSKFDKVAYQRDYMRKRRQRMREGE